ncbi:hypothetical protein MTP99_018611 [Tenebrio molitor]|nr:hypothetical protein MTP99_018611 [Tenebrio molitor]
MLANLMVAVLMYILPQTLEVASDLMSDEFVASINNMSTTWTAGAGINFPYMMLTNYESLSGTESWMNSDENISTMHHRRRYFDTIPDFFDARNKWPFCKDIINTVDHQGNCTSSSWAFAAASVMSDRMCIESKGKIKVHLSAEDMLSCCEECRKTGNGCSGGNILKTWKLWVRDGIVTGGYYGLNIGCKPVSASTFHESQSPKCQKICTNDKYKIRYRDDKHRGGLIYIISFDVRQIQTEIFKYGPVSATFYLWKDLFYYAKGVYAPVKGPKFGLHSVKILGWGTEDGTPYWLVANSWGRHWGNGGLFKYVRGVNAEEIERAIVAGRIDAKISPREELINPHSSSRPLQQTHQKTVMVGVVLINYVLATLFD